MRYVSTKEAAEILGLSERRVRSKIKSNHFENIKQCSCEHKAWLIGVEDTCETEQEKCPC